MYRSSETLHELLDSREKEWIWKLESLVPKGLNSDDCFYSQNKKTRKTRWYLLFFVQACLTFIFSAAPCVLFDLHLLCFNYLSCNNLPSYNPPLMPDTFLVCPFSKILAATGHLLSLFVCSVIAMCHVCFPHSWVVWLLLRRYILCISCTLYIIHPVPEEDTSVSKIRIEFCTEFLLTSFCPCSVWCFSFTIYIL